MNLSANNISNSKKLTRAMVTPEIAAFVVKDYLLPMFESDGKKLMTKKLTTGANNKRSQSNNEKISPKEAKIENNIDGLTPKDYK